MSKSRRYSLCIDPQGQANRFIRNLNKDLQLEIVKLSDDNLVRSKTPSDSVVPSSSKTSQKSSIQFSILFCKTRSTDRAVQKLSISVTLSFHTTEASDSTSQHSSRTRTSRQNSQQRCVCSTSLAHHQVSKSIFSLSSLVRRSQSSKR